MKLTHAVIIALAASLLTVSGLLYASNKRHAADAAESALNIEAARSRERECASALSAQNAAVERVRVDTVYLERSREVIVNKYKTVRDTIVKILEKDNSCETQVNLIDGLLRDFSDSRMRAEDSD